MPLPNVEKGENMRVRGFEKISIKQFTKDMAEEFYLTGSVVKNMYKAIKLPKRATKNSAGYDFFSPMAFELEPNQIIKVPLGIKAYMQYGEVLAIVNRSSLGFKYNVRLVNQLGIIDGDFYNNEGNEGHCWLKIQNEGDKTLVIHKGDAICQGIFLPFLLADEDTFEGETRVGGIGSTTTVK